MASGRARVASVLRIEVAPDRVLNGDLFNAGLKRALIAVGGPEADPSACVQCGTCTASCEVGEFMDLGPRLLMRMVKLGQVDRALRAESLWLCTGCNLCTSRCPYGVPVSAVIEALKSLAIRRGIASERAAYHRAFVRSVARGGLLSEAALLLRYAWATRPLAELGAQARLGLRLLRRGKISPGAGRVRDRQGFGRMMAALLGRLE
ncbi:MAG: 4Fe-4S dicluster domain-containing protein [Candidatus Methylomirabilia bacterium]